MKIFRRNSNLTNANVVLKSGRIIKTRFNKETKYSTTDFSEKTIFKMITRGLFSKVVFVTGDRIESIVITPVK